MWHTTRVLLRFSKMRKQLHGRSLPSLSSTSIILWKFTAWLSAGRVLRCCVQVWGTASWRTRMWKQMSGYMPSEVSSCTAETLLRVLLHCRLPCTHSLWPSHTHTPYHHNFPPALISPLPHCLTQPACTLLPTHCTLTCQLHRT